MLRPSGCSESPSSCAPSSLPTRPVSSSGMIRSWAARTTSASASRPSSSAAVSRTAAPQLHAASSTAAVCQCAGSATATVLPGPTSNSSCRRLAAFATQLANVVAESSTRSSVPSSYQVSSGAAGARRSAPASRSAGVTATPAVLPRPPSSVDAGRVGGGARGVGRDGGRGGGHHLERRADGGEVRAEHDLHRAGGGVVARGRGGTGELGGDGRRQVLVARGVADLGLRVRGLVRVTGAGDREPGGLQGRGGAGGQAGGARAVEVLELHLGRRPGGGCGRLARRRARRAGRRRPGLQL